MRILQARILEWVSMPFSRGSSQPRDLTQVSHIAGRFFTNWATGKALILYYLIFIHNIKPFPHFLLLRVLQTFTFFLITSSGTHRSIPSAILKWKMVFPRAFGNFHEAASRRNKEESSHRANWKILVYPTEQFVFSSQRDPQGLKVMLWADLCSFWQRSPL